MSRIDCSRCGSNAEPLAGAPLPGEAGELVLSGTCVGCWQLWLGEQVKLINENKLTPVNPEHYDYLVTEMKRFLKL